MLRLASSATTFAALALTLACKSPGSQAETSEAQPSKAEKQGEKQPAGQRLRAANIELEVPSDWLVLAEDEPNFALAYGTEQHSAHIPLCTIELRRQGIGPLPEDARAQEHESGVFEYQRGSLRGRLRTLPGPEGSSVVVHCRAPRSARQWGTVTQMFASLVETESAVELPPLRSSPAPESIVELCVGSPARMTTICARRANGSVYCGATTGTSLERVALPTPALEISCTHNLGCARDASQAVHCWRGSEPPELLAGIEGARSIGKHTIVDHAGQLLRRAEASLVPLAPFDDPGLASSDVDSALEGSNPAWGCVLRNDELWCWDREQALPLALSDDGRPQLVAPAVGASELQRMGERLCMKIGARWTCMDAAGERYELDGCEARACGCSLLGATRISCEHEPYERIDARPLGRLSNVVAVAEPCAALADGTVVCRGPVAGQSGADSQATQATQSIVSELPGIAHVLHLQD